MSEAKLYALPAPKKKRRRTTPVPATKAQLYARVVQVEHELESIKSLLGRENVTEARLLLGALEKCLGDTEALLQAAHHIRDVQSFRAGFDWKIDRLLTRLEKVEARALTPEEQEERAEERRRSQGRL